MINGNGATINGADVSSLFNISSGVTVTLKNLTITNAGGIYHDYSTGSHVVTAYHAIISEGTINIVDCIFKNSNLNDYSNPNINGSIYSTGNINIQNSKFIDNNVATYGVIYTSGTVTVSNSSFSNNKAQKGGAIYSKDKVIINNSTFDKNGGDSNLIGGAIYADSDVTIINSNFTENGNTKTGSQGGAIYTNGGIGLIENCIFTKNKAQEGGSIFINSSDCTTTIKNSNFMGDSQTTLTNGGAIYTNGGIDIMSLFRR